MCLNKKILKVIFQCIHVLLKEKNPNNVLHILSKFCLYVSLFDIYEHRTTVLTEIYVLNGNYINISETFNFTAIKYYYILNLKIDARSILSKL